MVIIFEDHKLFLKKLLEAQVDFILVGGYASFGDLKNQYGSFQRQS